MSRKIVGAGTSEDAWRSWPPLAALPVLDPSGVRHALVVAPHPDDEVLGPGGTLAVLAAAGTELTVLALTDGEASHPASEVDPAELGRRRAGETDEALRRLLGDGATVERLGLPDGALSQHEEAIAMAVAARLEPGDWCLVPHHDDGHPDHEAAARAAMAACTEVGARLVEFPIWLWHWSEPGEPAVDWTRARRVPLPDDVQARKREAVAAFRSQLEPHGRGPGGEPVLPLGVLARFERPWEVLFA